MAHASYVTSARAMALGAQPLAWFCAATWPTFSPPLTRASGEPRRQGRPRAVRRRVRSQRLLTTARDTLTRAEAVIVATAEAAVPDLIAARSGGDAFHALIRERDVAGLDAWTKAALASPPKGFAKGVAADQAAVAAAIETPWSNGQTEGQICRLKTLKRQMGGRANVDLLKARMLPAA